MSKQPEHGHSSAHNEAVEWDNELSTRTIVWSGVIILGLTVAAMLGMWLMTRALAGGELERDAKPAAVREQVEVPEIPGPALQATPELDLADLRASEREVLDSYEWLDEAAGIARLPIDRAMEMIAEGEVSYPPTFASSDTGLDAVVDAGTEPDAPVSAGEGGP